MNLPSFSISSVNSGNPSYSKTIPNELTSYQVAGALPLVAQFHSGCFLIQEILGKDYSICHYTVLLSEDDRFTICTQSPILSLNFCLKNSFFLYQQGRRQEIIFHEGQYNMTFLPGINLETEFLKGKVHSFLTLHYSTEWLLRISVAYPTLATFLEKVYLSEKSNLFTTNQNTGVSLNNLIIELLHSECKEEETKICIKKGKVSEILVQVLDRTLQQTHSTNVWISKEDTKKIYAARDWLDQQYDKPVTLFELARKVGMNVHKLSIGFAHITGTTVFHYHRKIRMQKAIQLLKDTDRDLFDIGTEIGYVDGKCFSKEFKKNQGITPLKFRKLYRTRQT